MLTTAKPDIDLPPARTLNDFAIGSMLTACDQHPSAPLVFSYDGRTIRPGYHVTEVKAGQFAALDCGGNPEAWSEIFIQLWDINEDDRSHMPAGKFAAIIRKVSDHVALDAGARLTFEVSDGVAPMQLHCASVVELGTGALAVSLSPCPPALSRPRPPRRAPQASSLR